MLKYSLREGIPITFWMWVSPRILNYERTNPCTGSPGVLCVILGSKGH